jgi:hypothetical protein
MTCRETVSRSLIVQSHFDLATGRSPLVEPIAMAFQHLQIGRQIDLF